jgi:hypothetical protein
MPQTGPITPGGRAVASRNAERHGLHSRAAVIGDESPDEWHTHTDDIVVALAPVGAVEAELAARVASLLWRLRRVPAAEAAFVARVAAREAAAAARRAETRAELGEDHFYASAFNPRPAEIPVPLPEADALHVVDRHEAHLNRQLLHTLHELEALQDRRRGRRTPLARVDLHGLREDEK